MRFEIFASACEPVTRQTLPVLHSGNPSQELLVSPSVQLSSGGSRSTMGPIDWVKEITYSKLGLCVQRSLSSLSLLIHRRLSVSLTLVVGAQYRFGGFTTELREHHNVFIKMRPERTDTLLIPA